MWKPKPKLVVKEGNSKNISPAYLEIMEKAAEGAPRMIEIYKEDSRLYGRDLQMYTTKLHHNSTQILEGKAGKGSGEMKAHLENNPEWRSQYKNMEIFVRAAEIINPEEGKRMREQLDIVYGFMNKKE